MTGSTTIVMGSPMPVTPISQAVAAIRRRIVPIASSLRRLAPPRAPARGVAPTKSVTPEPVSACWWRMIRPAVFWSLPATAGYTRMSIAAAGETRQHPSVPRHVTVMPIAMRTAIAISLSASPTLAKVARVTKTQIAWTNYIVPPMPVWRTARMATFAPLMPIAPPVSIAKKWPACAPVTGLPTIRVLWTAIVPPDCTVPPVPV